MPVQNTHWKVSVYSLWARAQAAQAYRADDRRPFASRQVVQCQLQPVRREEADVTNCAKLRSVGSHGESNSHLLCHCAIESRPLLRGQACPVGSACRRRSSDGERGARSRPPPTALLRRSRVTGGSRVTWFWLWYWLVVHTHSLSNDYYVKSICPSGGHGRGHRPA